jgi:hypothetical protein
MPVGTEAQFHEAMAEIYRRAKDEAGYPANIFIGMVADLGGLETARVLLHAKGVSAGYTALWERNRLDLTVEAVMLDPKWNSLFSDAERIIARKRLTEYGYMGCDEDTAKLEPGPSV